MKVGLYFGSFNPIHIGHLIVANHIVNNAEVDEVWFVVSPQNPLKESSSLLNEQHRYSLVKIAIEDEKKLKASNVEFSMPKPSYTIDTLIYLSEKFKQHHFTLIIGSDSYLNFEKWKNYKQIILNYNILIYPRPSFQIKENLPSSVKIVEAPLLEISSTQIRKHIKNNKSIRYMVTDKVLEQIELNGYYKSKLENPA
ncbi:MAG: nicotinate-nucleotide adenylyltransferase [Ferruginibacter sp.]|nr:nicotinate-nucleotide adenylyltransferase [Ferruginibacter sp.]